MDNKAVKYELTLAQDVVLYQNKLPVNKQWCNIISSINVTEDVDWSVMAKAFNIVAERNDCMRLRFFKEKGTAYQVFEKERVYNVPVIVFKTNEEFDRFILKIRKKEVKAFSGVVAEPYFIEIEDANRKLVLMKVAHIAFDVYGLNFIYQDLRKVYKALIEHSEMPACPGSFEALVQKDIKVKMNSTKVDEGKKFYIDYFSTRPGCQYAGLHGDNSPYWMKLKNKGKNTMRTFLVRCATISQTEPVDDRVLEKIEAFCKANSIPLSDFTFYTSHLAHSVINHFAKPLNAIDLMNMRGTIAEKNAAGTKANSFRLYIDFDRNKSFRENYKDYLEMRMQFQRYVGFPEIEFALIANEMWNLSLISTTVSNTFSFVGYENESEGIQVYSNGVFILVEYLAFVYFANPKKAMVSYECQKKIVSRQNIHDYHQLYMKVMERIADKPDTSFEELFANLV